MRSSRSSSTRCARSGSGPAHQTDALAELVCSNSLRGAALENAVGLLKEELARLDSLIVGAARASGGSGRRRAGRRSRALRRRGRVAPDGAPAHRGSCAKKSTTIDPAPAAIVACGPLPSRGAGARDRCAAGPRAGQRLEPSAPALLRCGFADRRRRLARRSTGCTASRATTKATATTISTSRSIASSTRQFVRDLRELPQARAERFRARRSGGQGALLRGLPADRRDGRARRRHAALRPAQTGRPARSAHRAARPTPSCNCAKRTPRAAPTTSSVFKRA